MWFQYNHLTPGTRSSGKKRKQPAQSAILARERIALWIAHRLLQQKPLLQVLPQGLCKTPKEHRSDKKTSLNAYDLLWDRSVLKVTLSSSLNLLRLHASKQGWGEISSHASTLCVAALKPKSLFMEWPFEVSGLLSLILRGPGFHSQCVRLSMCVSPCRIKA